MAAPPSKAQSFSNFTIAYFAATAASVAPILVTKSNTSKLQLIKNKLYLTNGRNIRIALLPTLLPVVYRQTERFVTRHRALGGLLQKRWPLLAYSSALPALLSSPLFLLLPAGLRVQVVLYAFSTLLYAYARLKPRREVPGKRGLVPKSVEEARYHWREWLPPVWTVSVLSDTWLLWSFLYEHYAFPQGYSKIIVDHSRRYLPETKTLEETLTNLRTTDHIPALITSPHTYRTCEFLHPTQVSCSVNYAKAFQDESAAAAPWVAAFTAFSVLASGSLKKKGPVGTFFEFLDGTARGTLYIAGSITTAWGITCLLQRLIPSGKMTRSRWLINGSLSNMWILLLSRSRQVAISLYQCRLALHSMWKVYKARGGFTIKRGEILLIALCWIGLQHIKPRTAENRIQGVVGQAMRLVDGTEAEDRLKRKADGAGSFDDS